MGVAKAILIGGIGFGLAAWFFHSHDASAASGSTIPTPGPGAKSSLETSAIPGLSQVSRTTWRVAGDASGQQPGMFILLQNAANPNDWVLAFNSDAGGLGVLQYSQTPTGGLLAQSIASGQ